MRTGSRKEKGDRGEELAAAFLLEQGFRIVQTHYRHGRGEIDIVAFDDDTLVFCEVKARSNEEFGDPEYAITRRKQAQIRKIAQGYLFEHEIKDQVCRFDVIAVRFQSGKPILRYLKDAF